MDKVVRPTTLAAAWRKVARNRGAAGVDGQSIERFAAQADRYVQELQHSLEDGSYRPHPVKRVEIPKGDGRTRPLGIPTVKDRIVQTALKMVIEPIFETQFRPGSYGFRPGRGCKDALREVDRLLKEGFTWVVDADLQSYFDSIPHDRLMALVAGPVAARRLPAAGHHEGHGALAADDGNPPRGGDLAAARQPLSAPARSPDGREWSPDGAVRR
jgi:RNA-directed DNA polymerase